MPKRALAAGCARYAIYKINSMRLLDKGHAMDLVWAHGGASKGADRYAILQSHANYKVEVRTLPLAARPALPAERAPDRPHSGDLAHACQPCKQARLSLYALLNHQ